jgi:hypothetical protein
MKTLYSDLNALESKAAEINTALPAMQDLLNEANKLNVVKINTIEEFKKLAENGEKYIKEKLAAQIDAPVFGLFKMKRAAFVDTLELPNMDNLNALAKEAMVNIKSIKYYAIKGAKVIVNEQAFEIMRQQNSVIAKTSEHLKFSDAFTSAAQALGVLHNTLKKLDGAGLNIESDVDRYFILNKDGVVTVNEFWYDRNRHLFQDAE